MRQEVRQDEGVQFSKWLPADLGHQNLGGLDKTGMLATSWSKWSPHHCLGSVEPSGVVCTWKAAVEGGSNSIEDDSIVTIIPLYIVG